MELVIASKNLHKVREYRELLKPYASIDVLSLHDFPHYVPTLMPQGTFKKNASAKAEQAANELKRWVLADESGIVIPSLDRAGKGVSFFVGDERTEADNRQRVLSALKDRSELERSAYLECCLVLANAEGIKKCCTGMCEGTIVEQERGSNGFGYDPIFRKHDYDKTFGELDPSVKIRVSDRRKAFEKLSLFLETLLP